MARSPRRTTAARSPARPITVERVQTGVRIERSILKVLRALAAYHEISLGDLLEGIVLHAFEGRAPFGPEGLRRIAELRRIYGMPFDATHSHRLVEKDGAGEAEAPTRRRPARTAGPARRPSTSRRA